MIDFENLKFCKNFSYDPKVPHSHMMRDLGMVCDDFERQKNLVTICDDPYRRVIKRLRQTFFHKIKPDNFQ